MGAQEYEEFRRYLAAVKEDREALEACRAASAAHDAAAQRRQVTFDELEKARRALIKAVEGER